MGHGLGAVRRLHSDPVRTGLDEGSVGESRYMWADIEPDFVAEDVLEAAQLESRFTGP